MPTIFEWSCTYYKNSTRKWISGKLRLRVNNISFVTESETDSDSDESWKLIFNFNEIQAMKKAKSSFIYNCIVFKLRGEGFWFSSFNNGDNVFNTIEYFWKQQLLEDCSSHGLHLQPANELLRIVHGTQDVLLDASRKLHNQGKQLNCMAETMNFIHNDITVAERLTDDLESYFSAWRIKKSPKTADVISEREIPPASSCIEYTMLYARFIQESHKSGYIVLRDETIDILNEKSESIFSSPVKQLSALDVHSPWDISITKRSIGQSDFTLHLISTKMPVVIQSLEILYGAVLNYDEPPTLDEEDGDNGIIEKAADFSRNEIITSNKNELFGSFTGRCEVFSRGHCQQISREENNELSKVLGNMKNIALDIGVEQDAQLKQIDSLNESIDKAQSRIKSTDWKIKKIM